LNDDTPDREAAVAQTVGVIKKRLDALRVSNFEVQSQRNGRILLNLPPIADPERLKSIITAGGKLELTHVISAENPAPVQTYSSKEAAIASLDSGGMVPANRRVLPYVEQLDFTTPDQVSKPKSAKWVVVESPVIIDGSALKDARAARSYDDHYDIRFSLNKTGAEKFGQWTGVNINEYLGVVLNDEVKSIAYIRSQITDEAQITGSFTQQSAEDLALVLRSGALPAPLRIVEERTDN